MARIKKVIVCILAVTMIFSGSLYGRGWTSPVYAADAENYLTSLTLKNTAKTSVASNAVEKVGDREYSVFIPDTAVGLFLFCDKNKNGKDTLYYQVKAPKANGNEATMPVKGVWMIPTNFMLQYLNIAGINIGKLNDFPVGSTTTKKLIIGKKDEKKNDFLEGSAQEYTINCFRQVMLNNLSASDENGVALSISPKFDQINEKDYGVRITKEMKSVTFSFDTKTPLAEKDEKGSLTKAGTELDFGTANGAITSNNGKNVTFDISKIPEDENGKKIIPVALKYVVSDKAAADNVKGSNYKLTIDVVNYTPEVTCSNEAEYTYDRTAAAKPLQVQEVIDEELKGTITYQWYQKKYPNTTRFLKIDDAIESAYTPSTENVSSAEYYCEVTNEVNGVQYPVQSKPVKVIVNPTSASKPDIKTQPSDIVCTRGSAQQLRVKAETPDQMEGGIKGEISYQWYQSESSTAEGTPLDKEVEASLTVPTNSVGTYYYYCIVTNSIGGDSSNKKTSVATVTVNEIPGMEDMKGAGTEEEPYEIYDITDLGKVKTAVESGIGFEGIYFKLMADINLPSDWEPIGGLKDPSQKDELDDGTEGGKNVNPFMGILDGKDGDTIHTVTIADGGMPLFKYVRKATIKNLDIHGKDIAGSALISSVFTDYGEDGNYNTGVPWTVVIDNVTLKNGSSTTGPGFLPGSGSGANRVTIMNSKIEKDVVIGVNGSGGGSFIGNLNGSIINCISYATVNGNGGIAGKKGESMGDCSIINCAFLGTVNSTSYAGGIIGSGYNGFSGGNNSAPNTPVVSVRNCYVIADIVGDSEKGVGGIIGTEPSCENCWANGEGTISNNYFKGTISSINNGKYLGGIAGFMKSFNKFQEFDNNYYVLNSGKSSGIGLIETIITKDNPKYGAAYGIEGTFNVDAYCIPTTAKKVGNGELAALLNAGKYSSKNWIQGKDGYPILSKTPVPYMLELSGDYPKKFNVGDKFSSENMVLTAVYTDGSKRPLTDEEMKQVEFSGYSSTVGEKEIKVRFNAAETKYKVTVLYAEPKEVTVKFSLLGDKVHTATESDCHTLAKGGLEQWIPETTYTITQNDTVKTVLDKALAENKMSCSNPTGNYVESITRNGVTLGEFTNGKMSGWMYTLNGIHSDLGVKEQYLKDGDVIVFHYTDDYTKEEGSDKWDVPVETTQPVVQDAPATVGKDGEAVSKVTASDVDKLVDEAVKQSATTIEVNVKGADKADKVTVELPKTSVSNIANKTDAELRVTTPAGIMTMDKQAMKESVKAASGSDLTIALNKQDIAGASKEPLGSTAAQTKVSILSGGKEIKDLGTAKVKILLPVSDAMKDKAMAAATVDENGKLTKTEGKLVTVNGKTYYQIETSKPGTFVVAESANIDAAIKQQAEENDTEKLIGDVKATTIKLKSKLNKRSIKLTWTKSADTEVDGYQIYRSIKKSAGYKKYATTKKLTYTNKAKLKKGTRYYYKVRGYKVIDGKNYYTQWSNKANRKMKANSLDYGVKKTTVKAKAAASKGAVKLTWTKSKGYKVDGYQVYRSANKTKNFKKLGTTAKKTFKNTKTLKKGKTYYYKVRGYRVLDGKKVYTKWSKTISVKAK